MKKSCALLLLTLSCCPVSSIGAEPNSFLFQDLKNHITDLKRRLDSDEKDKSQIHYELAKAYNKDQEIDSSFRHFLLALKSITLSKPYVPKEEEQSLYDKALNDYLGLVGTDPNLAAKNLLESYGKTANEHKDFLLLNFLISTAFANLGQYEDFYDRFYKAYPSLQDSFLAYKTQGILYLRLASRISQEEERHKFQEEAFQCLTVALDRNPMDCSLYKLLMFLAKEEENEALISTYLHKMHAHRVLIPRSDIYLYVREAVTLGEYDLAQKIIDHANTLYEFSRVISAAQEYLDQHRET